MKGIIVLEGSDGTGKTFLANKLVDRYGAKYIHCTYRWKEKMFNYHLAAIHRAVKLSKDHLVVLDRTWISECIYADVYRGGTKIPEAGRMFDRILRRFGAIYVLCTILKEDTYKSEYERIASNREELYKADDRILQVNRLYKKLYFGDPLCDKSNYASFVSSKSGFCIRHDCEIYDRTVNGKYIDSLIEYLANEAFSGRECLAANPFATDPSVYNLLGNPFSCRTLFIGDKINKEKRQIDYPWMAHKNSSLFFAKCLTELGVDERHTCYVNRNDKNGKEIIDSILKYRNPRIVYLGANSKAENSPSGHLIYHPSYALRFGAKEEFKKQLQSALHTD